jgi:hypothetical protein
MKTLLIDNWVKNKNKTEEYEVTSSESVPKVLRMLDGKKRTQLSIQDDEEEAAVIIGGGGEKGLFIINYVIGEAEESYIVTNPKLDNSKEEVSLVTGGQGGVFPIKYAASFDTAVKVLKFFIDESDMSPDVIWEEE